MESNQEFNSKSNSSNFIKFWFWVLESVARIRPKFNFSLIPFFMNNLLIYFKVFSLQIFDSTKVRVFFGGTYIYIYICFL